MTTPAPSTSVPALRRSIVGWYRLHGRVDLPWRRPSTTPWQQLVAEVMLAQTPVARVAPAYERWIDQWPDAASTAAASTAALLRAWDRLGYPRRALRLRECAAEITLRYDGQPPCDRERLRALPGVGEYTSAAVLAFAYGRRVEVLDTNVRRVIARAVTGTAAAPPSLTNSERTLAVSLLPRRHRDAAEWSIAVMELGALVCTATRPACPTCPVRRQCAWHAAGSPPSHLATPRGQSWHGTDRQCRGRLLGMLRAHDGPVSADDLAAVWLDGPQRERCLDSLLDDRLIDIVGTGLYALPE